MIEMRYENEASKSYYIWFSKWENNKSVPDITNLVQISDIYNVSLDYLIKSDKQLQNKLSIKKIRLRIMNLITIPFILFPFKY